MHNSLRAKQFELPRFFKRNSTAKDEEEMPHASIKNQNSQEDTKKNKEKQTLSTGSHKNNGKSSQYFEPLRKKLKEALKI